MNQVIFGSKQLHLGTVQLTTGMLAKFGITPARFDMLIAIATASPTGIAQRELRTLLGVTSPTISRMLKSLEILGFVKRSPHPRNPRHRWVTVTVGARFRLCSAMEEIVDGGDLAWLTEEFLNPKPGNHEEGARAIVETIAVLNRACLRLNHFATLVYTYDPPDLAA